MGAVRFRNEFYTDQNVKFRVDIWDDDWASATYTPLSDDGFEIEYDRPSQITDPLIGSTCFYKLYDDGSADFTSFITDISTAQEDEFRLIVYKYVGGSWDIYWAGVILTDVTTWNNENTARMFGIVAKCGLNRLQDIYFTKIDDAAYSSEPNTFIDIIKDCLSYNATAQFWNGSSKPYIVASPVWYDTQQTLSVATRLLECVSAAKEFLIDDAKGKTNTFRSSTDPPLKAKVILNDILRLLGLRILLADGSWHIKQIHASASTYNQSKYDYTGVYVSNGSVTHIKTENGGTLALLAGGKFSYYPPVKLAKAEIYASDIVNKLYTIGQNINTASTSYSGSAVNIGTLYGGAKYYMHFNLYFDVITFAAVVSPFIQIEVKVKVVAGSYRIKNNGQGQAKWTTTAADEYIDYIYFNSVIDGRPNIFPIETEEIPFAKESSCTVQVTLTLQKTTGSASYPGITQFNTYFQRLEMLLMDYNTSPPTTGQITAYELQNPSSTANSIDVDFGKMRMHDTGIISSKNVIEVLPTEASAASAWNKSNIWQTGYSSNERLIYSALREAIGLQKTTIKKYMGAFRSTIYEAWNAISYDGTVWVFMGGRYDAKSDTWDGDWFGVSRDTSIVPVGTTRVNDPSKNLIPNRGWGNPKPVPVKGGDVPVKGIKNDVSLPGGGAISIINTNGLPTDLLRAGDVVQLYSPKDNNLLDNVTLTADGIIGDTSISVSSFTPTYELWPGIAMAFDPDEIIASKILRAGQRVEIGYSSNYSKEIILRIQTASTTIQELTTNGNLPSGSTNRVPIPASTAASGIITITGKLTASNDSACYVRQVLISNNGGTTNIQGTVGTIGTDIESGALVGSTVTISANDGSDCLQVEITSATGSTVMWTAKIDLTYSKL